MSFIARQKNGLLCRFSTVIDTVCDYNMTDEEYNDMKDFVELNTETYSDVYFNQPTRNNY